MKAWIKGLTWCIVIAALTTHCTNPKSAPVIGQPIDSLNGVFIYYDEPTGDAGLPMKYPPVEFIKRYYAEALGVVLPDSLQSGMDFYDPAIPDGQVNSQTGLVQYTLPSMAPPRRNDIVVFSEASYDTRGHLAIVAEVNAQEIVLIQQNPGLLAKTRDPLRYYLRRKKWYVQHPHIIAWLHKEE